MSRNISELQSSYFQDNIDTPPIYFVIYGYPEFDNVIRLLQNDENEVALQRKEI